MSGDHGNLAIYNHIPYKVYICRLCFLIALEQISLSKYSLYSEVIGNWRKIALNSVDKYGKPKLLFFQGAAFFTEPLQTCGPVLLL